MTRRTLRGPSPRAIMRFMARAYSHRPEAPGPFTVDHLRPGDPYELSDGHPVVCEPAGPRHGRKNVAGAIVVDTDPAVEAAGVDIGYALGPRTMRAPDVSVGDGPDQEGFVHGAPALAVEYVEAKHDEHDLQRKIGELLAAGTKLVWVVRLGGERRVEVHRRTRKPRVARSGEELAAPGILRNRVPVDALYDRDLAHELALRNLLQREGYDSLAAAVAAARQEGWDQGREEGRHQGREEGALGQARRSLRALLTSRGIRIDGRRSRQMDSCSDLAMLERWFDRAVTAGSPDEVFRPALGAVAWSRLRTRRR